MAVVAQATGARIFLNDTNKDKDYDDDDKKMITVT